MYVTNAMLTARKY